MSRTPRPGPGETPSAAKPDPLPTLLRVEDVARRCAVSPRFIWGEIAAGRMRATRFGARTTRIASEELSRYLAAGRDAGRRAP